MLQDVFLTVYRTLTQEAPIRNVRPWLLTITRNRCLNLLRDSRRELPQEEAPAAVSAGQMEDEVIGRILSHAVLSCVTEEEHRIFALHCLDGYTYREIAEGLDMPIGTVQTKCRTARKKLKAAVRGL